MCKKRIFEPIPGTAFARPTNYVSTPNGIQPEMYNGNISSMAVAQVAQKGCPIMPMGQIINALGVAETQNSAPAVFRQETPSGSPSSAASTISITLNNTGAGAARIILGDGSGIYSAANNIGAIPGTLLIGGTYGANTLTLFNRRTSMLAIRVTKTLISASNELYFAQAQHLSFLCQIGGENINPATIDLSTLNYQNNFVTTQRVDDGNYLFTAASGLDITVPAGMSVTLTFNVQSEERAFGMVLN